jgi:hypothetical protein
MFTMQNIRSILEFLFHRLHLYVPYVFFFSLNNIEGKRLMWQDVASYVDASFLTEVYLFVTILEPSQLGVS